MARAIEHLNDDVRAQLKAVCGASIVDKPRCSFARAHFATLYSGYFHVSYSCVCVSVHVCACARRLADLANPTFLTALLALAGKPDTEIPASRPVGPGVCVPMQLPLGDIYRRCDVGDAEAEPA